MWTGAVRGDRYRYGRGYGVFWYKGKRWGAHRCSHDMFVGPIREGLTIDHLCRNTLCVNPFHIEVVTIQENVRRSNGISAENARKTRCKRGHPFTEENTVRHGDGRRECRECRRMRSRVGKLCRRPFVISIKMHCPHGHAYDEDNTYVNRRNQRICRACNRERARKRKSKEA